MDWKRMIIAIDDSPRAINAVEYVGSFLGRCEDVFLCLLHIYPEPPPDYYRSGASLDDSKKKGAGGAGKTAVRPGGKHSPAVWSCSCPHLFQMPDG